MTTTALLTRLESLLPAMRARAEALDARGTFPTEDIEDLRRIGVLHAPVPRQRGGLGVGVEPEAAGATLALFRLLGQGNLALGRLVEAHVNAMRLVFRFGDEAVRAQAAADAEAGHLCALWVTDPAGDGLAAGPDGSVSGAKQFCSGAGHATRAVVTAGADAATRLAYVALDRGVTVSPLPGGLAGMRAATTGQVAFDGARACLFGADGDYLREPDFSCGAWRTSAVTLGGMDALLAAFRAQLVQRRREGDSHQQAPSPTGCRRPGMRTSSLSSTADGSASPAPTPSSWPPAAPTPASGRRGAKRAGATAPR